MRILLVHNNYTIQGGAEVFYHEIARILKKNGHQVAMFSCAEEGLDIEGSRYFPEMANYKGGSIFSRLTQLPKNIYNKEAKTKIARLIEEFRPDLVHAFAVYVRLTPAVLDAAREAGVPIVLSCNDYKHICPNYKLYHHGHICEECKGGKFYKALVNRCCHDSSAYSAASMIEAYVHDWMDIWQKNISCFLFASKFMAQKTEEFWGKNVVNIDYLPNPFDASKHKVYPNVGRYILYFGRLIEEKGVNVLLDAAAIAPEVPVVVVGDGPDYNKLAARAQEMSNVRFVGPAWEDDLVQWLHGARAVVVPSLWHENFPYVIFQAFAAYKPVIGTHRGGIPELIQNGRHGWVYEATNVFELVDKMRYVVSMPDSDIADMGAVARDYVEREFSDVAIYKRLTSIYQKVLK